IRYSAGYGTGMTHAEETKAPATRGLSLLSACVITHCGDGLRIAEARRCTVDGHCKTAANKCEGICNCFCQCERCLAADEAAGKFDTSDEPDFDALYEAHQDYKAWER